MAIFITGKAVLGQDDKQEKWITLHNQLFADDDYNIYYVPRYFQTDGYSIPKCLTTIGGSKMEYDIRPAIQHDFECKYHKAIKVKISFSQLKQKGLVREIEKNGILLTICENIPLEYLEVVNVNFSQANNRFKRGLKAVGLTKARINMMHFAVYFNFGWLFSKKELDLEKLYKEKI